MMQQDEFKEKRKQVEIIIIGICLNLSINHEYSLIIESLNNLGINYEYSLIIESLNNLGIHYEYSFVIECGYWIICIFYIQINDFFNSKFK